MKLNIKPKVTTVASSDDRAMKAVFAERERQQEEAAYRTKLERDTAVQFGTGPGGLPADDLEKALRTAPRPVPTPDPDSDGEPLQGTLLRGQLTDRAALVRFLEAGRAILTVRSRTTGERFTFRFRRPTEEQNMSFNQRQPMIYQRAERPIWVSVLTGPDNESTYTMIGTLWPKAETGRYDWHHSRKTNIAPAAPSAIALRWLLGCLNRGATEKIFAQAEIWHEGRCARCGRRLTVPESIDTGFGPECAGIVGLR